MFLWITILNYVKSKLVFHFIWWLYEDLVELSIYVLIISCLCYVIGTLNVSVVDKNITSSSAELHFSISSQLRKVSGVIFNIQYNSTASTTQSSTNSTTPIDHVMLTGLSPNTEYTFWMAAITSDGREVTSGLMNFKTQFVGELTCLIGLHYGFICAHKVITNKFRNCFTFISCWGSMQ